MALSTPAHGQACRLGARPARGHRVQAGSRLCGDARPRAVCALGRAPREVNYATVSCSWGLSGPPLYFPLLKPAENRRRFIICPNRVINVLCHNGTIQIPQLIKYLRQTFKPDLRGEHMTVESSVSTPGAHTAWRLPVINSHMLSGAGNAKPKITVTLSPHHVFLLR